MANTLGIRIRFLRDEKNLSQREMADQLNISNVQLNRYESGARKPDPDMLVQIADYLNVTTDYLLGRTSSVRESDVPYLTREDSRFIQKAKHVHGLMDFFRYLTEHPDEAEKIMKIWLLIKKE
ncbi:helix-turn-helix transcriptional regulator [Sporolactobacillus sp. Y61]|uniref:Helix-turn-helix transcriptional regulator n=1 Tax=Sporolactobacillus sp. Y61 TaxID=3160863 RepID=A0AAU8ICF8_9BACL|nr:helix-turn-helix transcriptional regulator [Sporolactobacillus sp. THM19-2]